MKNAIIGTTMVIVAVLIAMIHMTVTTKDVRQNELNRSMNYAARTTVEVANSKKGKEKIETDEDLMDEFNQNLLSQITSDSEIEVQFMGVNAQQGLLDVKAISHFTYPIGSHGQVSSRKTVIVDEIKEKGVLAGGELFNETFSEEIKKKITDVKFTDTLPKELENYTFGVNKWDVSSLKDKSVIAWNDGTQLFIGSVGGVKSNTNISRMFENFTALKAVHFTELSSESLVFMNSAFKGCTSLTSVDLGTLDTKYVVDMSGLFEGCTSLTSINMKEVETNSLTNVKQMFKGCTKLETADLLDMDTERVMNFEGMFEGCSELIHVQDNFNLRSATSISKMFKDCEKLLAVRNLENWDVSNVVSMVSTFENCKMLPGSFVTPWDVSSLENAESMFKGCDKLNSLNVGQWETGQLKNVKSMFEGSGVVQLDMNGFKMGKLTSLENMFKDCKNLSKITTSSTDSGPVSSWDVSEVTSLKGTFDGCTKLATLDMTGWNLGKITDVSFAFRNCSNLASIDFKNWNTLALKSTESAFENASKLSGSIVIQGMGITNYNNMFKNTATDANAKVLVYDTGSTDSYNFVEKLVGTKQNPDANVIHVEMNSEMVTSTDFHTILGDHTKTIETIDFQTEIPDLSNYQEGVNLFDLSAKQNSSIMGWLDGTNLHIAGMGGVTMNEIESDGLFAKFSALKSVNFNNAFHLGYATDLSYMFSQCTSLESVDFTSVDTSKVTDMSKMFRECYSLQTLNLPINTSNVTDMSSMFEGCLTLKELNLSSFDTRNVEDMYGMFMGCETLSNLNILSFNTSKVTDMKYMFNDCLSLQILEQNFKTGNVTDMHGMFTGDSSLISLDVSNWDVSNVEDMGGLFTYCSSLASLNIQNWNTSKVTDMSSMFKDCSNLKTLAMNALDFDSVTDTSRMFQECSNLQGKITMTRSWENYASMFRDAASTSEAPIYVYSANANTRDFAKEVVATKGAESNKVYYVDYETTLVDGSYFNTMLTAEKENILKVEFVEDLPDLKDFAFGVDKWDISEAQDESAIAWKDGTTLFIGSLTKMMANEDVSHLFQGFTNVTDIQFNDFLDAKNVTDMSYMFDGCTQLTNVDVDTFNITSTGFVTDLSYAFRNCKSLQNLNLFYLQTSFVTDMTSMFEGCSKLMGVSGLKDFQTSSVTSFANMFKNCSMWISKLDLSSWNTASATNMSGMFEGCKRTTIIYLPNHLDINNVTDMSSMFAGCANLSTIQGIENLDTSRVFSMYRMFDGCSGLQSLDISKWDLTSVQTMSRMFAGCSNLSAYIQVSKGMSPDYADIFQNAATNPARRIFILDDQTQEAAELALRMEVSKGKDSQVYHLKQNATVLAGSDFNKKVKTKDITRIEFTDELPSLVDSGGQPVDMIEGGNILDLAVSELDDTHTPPGMDENGKPITYPDKYYNYSVLGWMDGDTLKIYSNGKAFGNEDCSKMFYNLTKLEGIEFGDKFDTSQVTNMQEMFLGTGATAKTFVLGGLNTWSTSNVTYMISMFSHAGQNATTFDIGDLSNWDTSNVFNMSYMFSSAGQNVTTFNLDLSNWDTSNVMDMNNMFSYAGLEATTLTIGDINTKKVTRANGTEYIAWQTHGVRDMSYMFTSTGRNSQTFSIDVSDWDTSNVQNMEAMFSSIGQYATGGTVEIKGIENWDVSSVENMSQMFWCTAEESKKFNIGDLSNWNVSNVTDMNLMFNCLGKLSETWSIGDLSNWNTSNVTNMSEMFCGAGHNATNKENTGLRIMNSMTNVTDMFTAYSDLTFANGTIEFVVDYSDGCRNKAKEAVLTSDNGLTNVHLSDYEVILNANGGTVSTTPIYIDWGKDISKLPTPTRDKYKFVGWSKTSTGTPLASNTILNQDCTLYAIWEKEGYSITWDANGGKMPGSYPTNYNSNEGLSASQMPVPTKEGYEFKGWMEIGEEMHAIIYYPDGSLNPEDFPREDIKFLDGMTWYDYIHSSYNTLGFKEMPGNLVGTKNNEYLSGEVDQFIYLNDKVQGTPIGNTYYYHSGFNPENVLEESGVLSGADDGYQTPGFEYLNSYVGQTWYDFMLNDDSFIDWKEEAESNGHAIEFVETDSGNHEIVFTTSNGEVGKLVDLNGKPIYLEDIIKENTAYLMIEQTKLPTPQYITSIPVGTEGDKHFVADWQVAPATLVSGSLFNSAIKAQNPNVTHIEFTETAVPDDQIANATIVSTPGGGKAYMYTMNGVTYISPEEDGVKIVGNEDSSMMFEDLFRVTEINFDNFDTSQITNMSYMFYSAGRSASTFDIGDLSNWDTNNVTNMGYMFRYAGENATTFNLDLSNWDTGSVTNMGYMFDSAGYKSTTWSIGDLSNWDTSSVTNMKSMFYQTGQNTTTWSIGDLSNWDTSSVTDMSWMFDSAGYNVTTWSIGDLSNWDTSSVNNMREMFYYAGHYAKTWSIGDLSNWDTSNVTNMSDMFSYAGYNASTFDIGDLSNWDTSNVTNMGSMFDYAGYKATNSYKTGIRIMNSNTNVSNMFLYAFNKGTIDFTVDYADGCRDKAKEAVATKSSNANVHLSDYEITFDANGGTLRDDTKKLYKWNRRDSETGDVLYPVRDGYKFIGWATAPTGGEVVTDKNGWFNTPMNKDCTVYAQWKKEYANITYDTNGGTLPSGYPTKFNIDTGLSNLPTPTRDGYEFKGWYDYIEWTQFRQMNSEASVKLHIQGAEYDLKQDDSYYYLQVKREDGTDAGISDIWEALDANGNDVMDYISYKEFSDEIKIRKDIPDEFDITTLDFTFIVPGITPDSNVIFLVETRGNLITSIAPGTEKDIHLVADWQKEPAVLLSGSNFNNKLDAYKDTVTSIEFVDGKPGGTTGGSTIDVSEKQNGSITAWVSPDETQIRIWSEDGGKVEANQDCSSMFYNFKKVESIEFNDLFDTSQVTDMNFMFYYAGYKATTWTIGDVSNWDTSNVTNMSGMFSNAGENATTFDIGDLSNWDTSNVTNMSGMFSNAGENATTFDIGDLSNWDTSSVTDMSYMFSYAGFNAKTWSIGDLSNWDTSNVTNMSGMFDNAGFNAKTWSIGDLSNWDTSNVTDMSWMFSNAGFYATTFNLDLSNWDTSSVTNIVRMFDSAGYNATTWSIGDLSNWDTSSVTNMRHMFSSAGYKATTWSIGDLSNWDTRNVTDMSWMFDNAGYNATSGTTILKFSKLNRSVNYTEMFNNAVKSGAEIIVYDDGTKEAYDLVEKMIATKSSNSNVTHGGVLKTGQQLVSVLTPYMEKAETIKFSKTTPKGATNAVDISRDGNGTAMVWLDEANKVLYIYNPHGHAIMANPNSAMLFMTMPMSSKVKTIDFNNAFKTSVVTDMNSMFGNQTSLQTINLEGIDTSQVKNMSSMFSGCENLTSLDLSDFDTSQVTMMSSMFQNCKKLQSLDVSGFDTSKVTAMNYMFSGLTMKKLDLSNFDTSAVTNMAYMFSNSSQLKDVFVMDTWTTKNVTLSTGMFQNCTSIVGKAGYGTRYDASKVDASMANYDNGYLTYGGYALEGEDFSSEISAPYEQGQIQNIVFTDNQKPQDISEYTDLSYVGNESVIGWYEEDTATYYVSSQRKGHKVMCHPNSYNMFYCRQDEFGKVRRIDVSMLDTSHVIDMEGMFQVVGAYSDSLEIIGLETWNTSNVVNMDKMFYYTGYKQVSLEGINNWDVSNVYSMVSMFSEFGRSVKNFSLDITGWNTSQVTNMSGMFYHAGQNAETWQVIGLEDLDVSKVQRMTHMFSEIGTKAPNLTLDLSKWNIQISNYMDMSGIFDNCTTLTTIYVGDNWKDIRTGYNTTMFEGCISLVGQSGQKYDPNRVDDTMANWETGYFTYKKS